VWLLSHSVRSLIQGTVREPVEFYQKVEGNAGLWGKAVSTIDASAARVFADMWCKNSHENRKNYVEKQGPDALSKAVHMEDSHSMLLVNLVRLPSPVSNRVFSTWFTWRKEPDNSFLVAYGPMSDYKRFNSSTVDINKALEADAAASKAIRGTVRGYWRIKPLAPSVCEVTYIAQAELGGSIPSALLHTGIKDTLGVLLTMQVKFARNGKLVDREMRDVFASPPPLVELSEEQMSVVEDCRSLESEDGSEWETLASPSPFVSMWMKRAPAKENERSIAIGKATAIIDCPVHEAVGESSEASACGAARRTFRTSDRRNCVLRRLV